MDVRAIVCSVESKNIHAVSLGRLGGRRRAQVLTKKEQQEIAQKAGQVGGKARAQKLSRKRRSEIARKAAEARWAKTKSELRPE